MFATQTAIAHPPSNHPMAMAHSPPTSKKGLGFFKRHLGHKRRSSSISFANGTPDTLQVQQQSQQETTSSTAASHSTTIKHTIIRQTPATETLPVLSQPGTPTINIRRPSETPQNSEPSRPNHTRTFSDETQQSIQTLSDDAIGSGSDRPSSSRGVRWAPGFDENSEEGFDRLRRLSSGATRNRRSSIYARSANGLYDEGVDKGVGSKARRLSVLIPKSFEVDEIPLNEYFGLFERKTKKHIGEGGAAAVSLMHGKSAVTTRKDKLLAVKEFRPWEPDQESNEEYQRKIKSEYAIAKSLEHANIVETYQLCIEKGDRWYHVMEFCDVGDLNDAIQDNFFSREDRDCLFKQLLRGVQYLHSRGIAHRDIKSENLLIAADGCLKIADFGTSEVFSGQHPGLRHCRRPSIIAPGAEIRLSTPGLVGSKPYMAPELLLRESNYDPRGVDVWSCAIVYITLILGGTPWESAETKVKNYNLFCSTWDKYLERFPDGKLSEDRPLPSWSQTKNFAQLGDLAIKRLILGMLHPDPKMRITATEAVDCVTVTEFPCCQQDGYSDDIKTRQRKALHNHIPPEKRKKIKATQAAHAAH